MPTSTRKVLITGAGGWIGRHLSQTFKDKYDLRLMIRAEKERPHVEGLGEVVVADLADLPRMTEICEGINTVIHLAGLPLPWAKWEQLLPNNIVGTYNTFAAAKAAGCRRVVFASSIHAVSGYPRDVKVKTDDPVNPEDLYGVTKCFGEALGRYMAEKQGLSVIAIRIGGYQDFHDPYHPHGPIMDAFISKGDMAQLMRLCIEKEGVDFAIVNGVSGNAYDRLDLSSTRELLGYSPQDDFTNEHPLLAGLNVPQPMRSYDETT